MSQSLFREVSLKKLSSPEQLDERIKVTSSRAWLSLIAISCIIVSVVVWSFLGSVPAKIEGKGILLNNGGVFTVTHNASGQVTDIRIKPGDMVKKGDVIARIDMPDLVDKINGLLNTISDMKNSGKVNGPKYEAAEKQVLNYRKELDYESRIISPIDGRVLEMNINKGSIVQPGESLLSLEQYGGTVKLEAIIYVSAEQGQKILPGMEVQVSPVIVNKEEYGFMLGRVSSVSKYPVTTQSMMQTLGNENLVSLLEGQGAPLMARIDLIPDSNTKSGYKWSSNKGPSMSISSGTIIQSEVIIDREKPISKVIPLFGNIVK